MSDIALFAISAQRMEWLSVRQTAVAGNVANVDTPGYKARDVPAFESYLDGSRLEVAVTSKGHIGAPDASLSSVVASETVGGEAKHSGNTVSLEHELLRAGEVSSAHSLTTAVVRSFHQMVISAVRD